MTIGAEGDAPEIASDGSPPARPSGPRPALALIIGVVVIAVVTTVVFVITNRSAPGDDTSGPQPILPGWQFREAINTARDDFGTVPVGNRIWIGGGMTGDRGNKLATTEWFDPATNAWSLGNPLPTARSSLGATLLGGVIYTVGGATLERPALPTVEAYDTKANTWTTLAPMPTARYELGVVTLDGKIWAIGGRTIDGPVDTVEIYDPGSNTWTTGPSLRIARSGLRTAVFDGKIYAVGGLIVNGNIAVVEIYDPASGSWSDGPSLPVALSNFGLTVYNDQVHVVYHQYHLVLGVSDTRWLMEEAPPITRHGLGLAALGGVLYAIGGCTQEPLVDVNIVQAWTPPDGSVSRTPPPDQIAARAAAKRAA